MLKKADSDNNKVILFNKIPAVIDKKVSSRIFFVGQTWKFNTETLTHKNNVKDTKAYLDELFGSKYLIISMEPHLEDFDRVLYCPDLWYDLEYINRICIAVKAWLDIDESNVIVVEINYNEVTLFAILFNAILVHCGHENSIIENIFIENEILRSKTNNQNTISRYNSYYSSLIHSSKTEIRSIVLLHQIIISNYHHFENCKNFRVQLKIFHKNKNIRTIHDIDDIDVVYKDDYHIVFTNIDIEANCDITIGLFFILDTKEEEFFKFVINGNCHGQGLFRFKKNDLISEYKYKFSDDFKLDIVFLESDKYYTPKKTIKELDLIQGIRHLTEFSNKELDIVFEKYISLGYNRIISKLISQMLFSDEYVKEFISLLRKKGYNNLISKSKPLHVSQIIFKNDNKINQSLKQDEEVYPVLKEQLINREHVYKGLRGKEILKIEPINEAIYLESKPNLQQKKMVIRKKSQIDMNDEPPALVSLKPLHWMPIVVQDKTIFNELVDYELNYDLKKFEKYFCVRNIENNEIKSNLKEGFHLIDSKRLFLVSLALNHLHKKGITHENVYDLLKNKPNLIQIQDLLNIEKIFPTYEETYLLASGDLERLSPEEKSMLNFSRLSEVKKIVEILIFERKFFDEIFLIDDILERYDYTLTKIIESRDIRILLKAFLDVGNLINYDYSLRRKKLDSFRLSNIYLFMDFKGKDDYHILNFIISSINRPNLVENLKKDFKYVEILRKESFNKIKDKINQFIELQISKLDAYYSLEYDKEVFTNLFIFSSEKLSLSKIKFSKCQEKIKKVVELFGESQKKSISDIFRNIYDLLKGLEEHI